MSYGLDGLLGQPALGVSSDDLDRIGTQQCGVGIQLPRDGIGTLDHRHP